jgi:hypothetical protein
VLATVTLSALVAVLTTGATAAGRTMAVGIYDDAQILYGNPDKVFPTLAQMNTRLIRVNLWWGGPNGVGRQEPDDAADPADSAYQWATYDRAVVYAHRFKIDVMLSILGTPDWANDGKGWNVAPTDPDDLRDFARAAARRYNGAFRAADGTRLPKVRLWTVWNEPNNPVFLKPQWEKVGGTWEVRSAIDYAAMCNAAVAGIRSGSGGVRIACGVTSPRGNNNPNSARPSVSPIPFLNAFRAAGGRGFDAIAHHPYYGAKGETPSTPPPRGSRGQPPTAVTLGNFATLVTAVDRLWGEKTRIWITEYGYQTNPPDRRFGVDWITQANYLGQAVAIARKSPRIDYFVWFLLRDESRLAGWQSGLYTASGARKPAREVFERFGR